MTAVHRVYMVDAGQGDSLCVVTRTGELFVIDCNRIARAEPPPVLDLLDRLAQERNSADIDMLCITHPHFDHFAGMVEVIEWCKRRRGEIKNIVCFAGAEYQSLRVALEEAELLPARGPNLVLAEFLTLMKTIEEFRRRRRGNYFRAGSFTPVLEGEGWALDIVGPSDGIIEENLERRGRRLVKELAEGLTRDDGDFNRWSCLMALRHEALAVLFTGDAPVGIVEEAWAQYRRLSRFDGRLAVVKMPHHGSEEHDEDERRRGRAFWKTALTSGAVALLSYGRRNHYRHPSPGLLDEFAAWEVVTASTNPCARCEEHGISEIDAILSDEDDFVQMNIGRAAVVEVEVSGAGLRRIDGGWKARPCKWCNSFS